MIRVALILAGVLVWPLSCTSTPVVSSPTPPLCVEVVGFTGCPNSPELLYRVQLAAAAADGDVQVGFIDQQALDETDARRLWPAPTVLVHSADLFGTQPQEEPALGCRIYPDGLPSVAQLTARLQAATD